LFPSSRVLQLCILGSLFCYTQKAVNLQTEG
jgi:hypothetical protein